MNGDPSFASDAVGLWSSILTRHDGELPLPRDAMPFAHALYASSLARLGRDKEALVQYKESLEFLEGQSNVSVAEIDVRMGMGKSLQRLLRYRDAKDMFLDVAFRCSGEESFLASCSEALQRGVLCCMRLGDVEDALSAIDEFEAVTKHKKQKYITGIKGALLLTQSKYGVDVDEARNLLKYAESESIMFKWLLATTHREHTGSLSFSNNIQEFAAINNHGFDDPCLVYLDDKILLHSIIVEDSLANVSGYYPQSFVIPQDLDQFKDACRNDDNKWMLKDRSGYGSHGNQIVSAARVLKYTPSDGPILCQRIINPPMLLCGRKFTIRIYVVYFPKGNNLKAEVYLSSAGLVKFASAEINGNGSLEDKYMTNSGRGDGRRAMQYDLEYLKRDLEESDPFGYSILWNKIENIVRRVMSRYTALRWEQSVIDKRDMIYRDISFDIPINHDSPTLNCIPKILGFDFMMDEHQMPWLLEVNRFPGLEPRSLRDADVKATVVHDAWLAAADRVGIELERTVMDEMCPIDYKSYSLVKLDTTSSVK